jgi:lipid-A-disaccharide synthase
LKHAKFAIVKSGTSTLEAGIIGTPFIVVYKTNILTYWIGKSLIKINNIALANSVTEKKIVPELIQNEVNPEIIFSECSKILSDENELSRLRNELSVIKDKLYTEGDPSKKAAEIIFSELNG